MGYRHLLQLLGNDVRVEIAVHAQVYVLHLVQSLISGLDVNIDGRLNGGNFLSNILGSPLPLRVLADVADVTARKVN